mgnify:CR=1 FL=1
MDFSEFKDFDSHLTVFGTEKEEKNCPPKWTEKTQPFQIDFFILRLR